MERPFICKCLTAEYEEEKSVLRGPVHIQFDIGKEQLFHVDIEQAVKYSLQGTTQGRYLTGGVPPVRFSM